MNPLIRTVVELDTRVDRREQGLRAGLRSHEPGGRTANARRWTTRTWGSRCSRGTSTPPTSAAGARGRTTGRWASAIQHEVAPRVSVTVDYIRNWWGNWYVVDNRATSRRGLHAVQHPGADRSAAAGRRRPRRSAACTTSSRPRSGQVDELAQSYKNFGEQTENWQGVDVSVVGAAAERAHGAGGHEHRAQARGRLRRAGEVAGAGLERHRTGNQQLRDGERQRPRRRPVRASR